MDPRSLFKKALQMLLIPIIYRHCPIVLEPPRLYFWLDVLYRTRSLPGAVVEIGVAKGGTAAFSFNFLRQIQSNREYVGIDTFAGFKKDQFLEDVRLGNNWDNFRAFSANSLGICRRVLRIHNAQEVKLVEGDISNIDDDRLPSNISACLLDVDLAVPIYDGLKLIWARMEDGGVVVVDDCYENNKGEWQALAGYRRFCTENGLNEHYFCGTGYLVKGDPTAMAYLSSAPLFMRHQSLLYGG
jgi:O-methyltransferase